MSDTSDPVSKRLHPQETVQKVLLSSTCLFVGQLEQSGVLLTHAWPGFRDPVGATRRNEGPLSRHAFVFCFETSPLEKGVGVVLPDFTWVGDSMASLLSVLYGKRFDNHGLIEGIGMFSLPDMTAFASICDASLAYNSHRVRANFPVDLNIGEAGRIITFFTHREANERFARTFETACSFYGRALRAAEIDPEVAYLHLITAGEILAGYFERDQDTLLDEAMKSALIEIASGLPNGEKIAKSIRGRLLQVKRRFVKAFTELVTPDFFSDAEARQQFLGLNPDTFEERMAAAYDLRSKFVHTGIHFGSWIAPQRDHGAEIQMGKPVVSDKEFGKILAMAPTFIGLERATRFALLRFASMEGRDVFPELTGRSVSAG